MYKKNIIFIVSLIIFLSIIIVDVNAYRKICLKDGESVPLPPNTPRYTCHLSSGTGFCQVCTTDDYFPTGPNYCLGIGNCEPLSGQQTTELELTVGINDGDIFSSKSISLNINTNKNAEIKYKDNTDNKWIKLCTYCNNHNKKRSFKEGLNDITVRATRDGIVKEETITFFIDTKKPRITKILPSSNSYINKGEFLISYDELNLKQISLYINNNLIEIKTDCPKGIKQTCIFNEDLSAYNGQEIEFYFKVEDSINVVNSKTNKKIKVDLTNPILTVNSPLSQDYNNKKILFDLTADDKYKLQYSLDNIKYRTLCSNCNKYSNYKTFYPGNYNLYLQAVDKAGNIDQEIINFNVI